MVVAFLGRRQALAKPDLVPIYCTLLMAVTAPTRPVDILCPP